MVSLETAGYLLAFKIYRDVNGKNKNKPGAKKCSTVKNNLLANKQAQNSSFCVVLHTLA